MSQLVKSVVGAVLLTVLWALLCLLHVSSTGYSVNVGIGRAQYVHVEWFYGTSNVDGWVGDEGCSLVGNSRE